MKIILINIYKTEYKINKTDKKERKNSSFDSGRENDCKYKLKSLSVVINNIKLEE